MTLLPFPQRDVDDATRGINTLAQARFVTQRDAQPTGTRIDSVDQLAQWLAIAHRRNARPINAGLQHSRSTWTAPSRLHRGDPNHVACAAGGPVLSAGEITFDDDMTVAEITNQSTGFCPEPESWPAVSDALDRARDQTSRTIHHRGDFPAVSEMRRTQHRQRFLVLLRNL